MVKGSRRKASVSRHPRPSGGVTLSNPLPLDIDPQSGLTEYIQVPTGGLRKVPWYTYLRKVKGRSRRVRIWVFRKYQPYVWDARVTSPPPPPRPPKKPVGRRRPRWDLLIDWREYLHTEEEIDIVRTDYFHRSKVDQWERTDIIDMNDLFIWKERLAHRRWTHFGSELGVMVVWAQVINTKKEPGDEGYTFLWRRTRQVLMDPDMVIKNWKQYNALKDELFEEIKRTADDCHDKGGNAYLEVIQVVGHTGWWMRPHDPLWEKAARMVQEGTE